MNMDDGSLERLLTAAGRAAAVPDPPPDLADRVRRRRGQRRRGRRAVGGLSVAILLVAGATFAKLHWPDSTPSQEMPVADGSHTDNTESPAAVDTDELLAEIARLDAEVKRLQDDVKRITRQQDLRRRIARLKPVGLGLTPINSAEIEFEKTAFLLAEYGNQQKLAGKDDESQRTYRQVVQLFPNTNGAASAQSKLNTSSHNEGEL